jgi:hypothetical protein
MPSWCRSPCDLLNARVGDGLLACEEDAVVERAPVPADDYCAVTGPDAAGWVLIGFTLAQSAPAMAYTYPLHHQPGETGSGQAVVQQEPGGWSIQMNVKHLRQLPSGQFYECVYAGPHNRPGFPAAATMAAAARPSRTQRPTSASP